MTLSLSRVLACAGLSVALLTNSLQAETSAASYLVALQADRFNDFETSADYYLDALFFDPANAVLAHGAVGALMAQGDFRKAAEVATPLIGTEDEDTTTYMAVVADAAIEKDYRRIIALLDRPEVSTNKLTDDLVLGWAYIGAGEIDKGYSVFQSVADQDRYKALGLNHLGLAKAYTGDYEGALATFHQAAEHNFQSPRAVVAEAQILAHLGRTTEAVRRLLEVRDQDPDATRLMTQINNGETVDFTLITSPADGMAEMFYTLGDALNRDTPNLYNLYYAQMAAQLRPDDSSSLLLVADMFNELGLYGMARDAYSGVAATDPAYFSAAEGVAETLRSQGQQEAAAAHLRLVIDEVGAGPFVLVTLGDTYRKLGKYKQAEAAYTQRLEGSEIGGYQDWYVYYVRGITRERLSDWPAAEADFRTALRLSPNQAQVLNYFGYSLVERRETLDEALAMIQKAVALRPDSGYIVDSLGWVFYRLGRFEDAVVPMELAVELLATDPIVNDHLGDVYWKVGRKYEAQFQWKRALSFDPDPADADRIRRKLDVGLDAVLTDESGGVDG